ncbi:hypothetical protein O9G_004639 [Rozella allomycis CSF55]|uniref:Uncharacterized protein n=1 Tax=Rozella allomycis (strain CSF55) TaxID=988480 RepID=A0A075ATC8_ROZAC|nr:hypothetical protein O9G_004639 [Rozella allomycis CSF55]|eukprot:EPZ33425.1 hypothetical protein O9G_004639 [Rozella allomycis CSF55]
MVNQKKSVERKETLSMTKQNLIKNQMKLEDEERKLYEYRIQQEIRSAFDDDEWEEIEYFEDASNDFDVSEAPESVNTIIRKITMPSIRENATISVKFTKIEQMPQQSVARSSINDKLWKKAIAFIDNQNYHSAINVLTEIIDKRFDFLEARIKRSYCYKSLEQYDNSLNDSALALQILDSKSLRDFGDGTLERPFNTNPDMIQEEEFRDKQRAMLFLERASVFVSLNDKKNERAMKLKKIDEKIQDDIKEIKLKLVS